MRTVDYSTLLGETATECGLDPDNIATAEFTALRGYHNKRLQTAWEYHYWPDLMRCEQRWFRPDWDSATAFTATLERYYPLTGKYYQALQASTNQAPADSDEVVNLTYWAECAEDYSADEYDNTADYVQGNQARYGRNFYQLFALTSTGNLPSDATKWGLLTRFDRYIAYEQTSQTKFEDVFGAYSDNPRLTTRNTELLKFRSNNGLQILSPADDAWIEFRLRRPALVGALYSSSTVYAVNRQMYYTTTTGAGNFYDCITATNAGESPETHPAKWSVVEIPLMFSSYLVYGATADYFRTEKQYDAAGEYAIKADGNGDDKPGELATQKTLLTDQQGDRQTTIVRTR